MASISDSALILGSIAIGVFFGIEVTHDYFNIDVDDPLMGGIITLILIIGILLLILGGIYKIKKSKLLG